MGNCNSLLAPKPEEPKPTGKVSPEGTDENQNNENEDSKDDLSEDESDEGIFSREINAKYIDNEDELGDDTGLAVRKAEDMNEEEAEMRGMAVKAWKGAIFAPDNAPEFNPSEPDENLEIEWVYGYAGHLRSVIALDNNNNLIYPTASLSIIYNVDNHTQNYSTGNTDDISAFARNPNNKNIFATGQVATIENRRATLPHISVFDTNNKDNLIILKSSLLKRSVRCLTFDPSGKYLACVGDDNEYTVLVFDWENKSLICSKKSGTSRIYGIEWNNETNPNQFCTIGKNCVLFWTFSDGSITSKRGLFGRFKRRSFYGLYYSPKGKLLAGSNYGELYIFDNGSCKVTKKIHKGAIYCLTTGNENIITGGRDGYVRILDEKLGIKHEYNFHSKVRSLYYDDNNSILYVGTSNAIYKCTDINVLSENNEILKTHCNGELWSICNLSNNQFITAGEDNQIIIWDSEKKKSIMKNIISNKAGVKYKRRRAGTTSTEHENKCARSIAYLSNNNHIAIGLNSGELNIYTLDDLALYKSINLNKYSKRNVINQHSNWIQTCQYSPNGKYLAVGTHGLSIIFLDVENDYKIIHTSKIHNSAITHIDWSKDSNHIRSNCRAYELIFHDINENNITHNTKPSELKNIEWNNCNTLCWSTQSVFDSDQDGTDINMRCKNSNNTLIATGDDKGKVTLFRYPVIDDASSKKYTGHSSHVMNVIFNEKDSKLFSVGGNDRTIIQWKIT